MDRLVPTRAAWLTVVFTTLIAVIGIAMSYGIGAAATAGLLIPLAAPLGIGLVLAMAWIPARAQLIGWAALTVWLLSTTYLGVGDQEYLALGAIVILSLLGVFKSPWFLVAAWGVHPLWDLLVPRTLAEGMTDLPLACVIYDLIIAAYLAWRTLRGRFVAVGAPPAVPWSTALRHSGFALVVGVVLLAQVLLVDAATRNGTVEWWAVPVGVLVVCGLVWLPRTPQLVGWVVVTAWMAMTYAHSGLWYEILVFLVLLVVAVLGFVVSPWYLVAAWGVHLAWDFVPRVIDHTAAVGMGHLGHAPLAAALYEGVVLAYLVFAVLVGPLRVSRAAAAVAQPA